MKLKLENSYRDPEGRVRCKVCDALWNDRNHGNPPHEWCNREPGDGDRLRPYEGVKIPPGPYVPRAQVPVVTHEHDAGEGGTPEWSYQLEVYLEGSDSRQRFEQALSDKSLRLYEVYTSRFNGGEQLVDIARRLGKEPSAIRERMRQVRIFARGWLAQEQRRRFARVVLQEDDAA